MIVLDDPQKADEALSETSRKATHTWFDGPLGRGFFRRIPGDTLASSA
jgi:hypothetical protein